MYYSSIVVLTAALVFPATGTPVAILPRANLARDAASYSAAVVNEHNKFRSQHSAPNIAFDTGLASDAATAAAKCVFAHDLSEGGGNYGQNIFFFGSATASSSDNADTIVTQAIDSWYAENVNFPASDFGVANPPTSSSGSFLDFTQIIWKATTSVGCASQFCAAGTISADEGTWFSVCNYSPQGNVEGQFAANLSPS